jgi:hypothetical protein
LVVQKTGWGKSFVYFIATKLLREAGAGPSLLISPLLALMRNQIAAAERMGVRAVTINSDNQNEWTSVEARIQRNEVDILLISPERLANERFRAGALAGIAGRIALLVIDEAHCISDWGHDFRPHYRLLERMVRALPANLRLLATTATANNRVMDDLRMTLGPNLEVSRGDLNRPSLVLQTMRLPSQAERLAWLAAQVAVLLPAGRALDAAYGVLLSGEEETEIIDYFIESAFPTREEVSGVHEALDAAPEGLSVPDLMTRINLSKGRIEKALALLSLESPAPIVKQGTKWQLTAANLSEAFWQRAERLTSLRRDEKRQMQEYVRLESGHMEFLVRALDGDPTTIRSPALPPLPATTDPALARAAVEFLRRTSLPIEPRKKWPDGGMPRYSLRGTIAPALQSQPGKALCVWGDAGWGALVRQGKYRDQRFSDELVDACVRLIWGWNPQPRACLGNQHSVASPPRSCARFRPAAGRRLEPTIRRGAGEN